MPRGRKSKLRAREKRRQARSEAQAIQSAQATAAKDRENPSSSTSSCGGNLQSPSSYESHSDSKQSQRATTTSASASCTKYNEAAKRQDGARPSTSSTLPTTDYSFSNNLDDIAILMVLYILQKYNKREPIIREDILENVIPQNKDEFTAILKKASDIMVLAFGIDVKEIDPTRHHYALVSKLNPLGDAVLNGEKIMPQTGLLMTILCVIFIKGNCASEEHIWEVLNVLEIYAGINHFIYGDVQKLITEDLVRDRYLEYRQVPNSDPPRYQFLWGPRAYNEISKVTVLEFLAKIYNTVPSAFPSLYREALRDEEERTRSRFVAMLLAGAMASVHSRDNYSRSSNAPSA